MGNYFISSVNGDLIYQFNPKTNELTKMVAAVENTWYDKMQIDDEGKWIFVSGGRNTTYFLRAIPISNPNSPVNVYYSSNSDGQISINHWVYDVNNSTLFFIANSGKDSGLFYATKAGGFKDKKFYHSYVGDAFENNFFQAFYLWIGDCYWSNNNFLEDGSFDSSKVIDVLLSKSYYDEEAEQWKSFTREDVDIRFDKYWSATDTLKTLAVLTRGKKNEEAIEALNNTVGLTALCSINGYDSEGNEWFENVRGTGYRHNFLADIFYLKNTDILLVDANDNAKKMFELQSNGLFANTDQQYFVSCDSNYKNKTITFGFSDAYYNSDGTLKYSLLKEKFFEYCNVAGDKEFRLTAFKNDEKYGSLYSTLTNEDAIEWIAAEPERMNLFGQYAGMTYRYNPKVERDDVMLDYASFMKMISKTCFIVGTDKKACTWNWDYIKDDNTTDFYINYLSSWPIEGNLFVTEKGVFYEYTNLTDSNYSWSSEQKYYYVVQVADTNGNIVEIVNKLPLPDGKVVQSERNKDRILLQYSAMNEDGSEKGYHHIYAVEMETGEVTNCFDNVPNRNSLEVVSFNTAGDMLYFSAVRGTSVENGIVNIVTNEYNPLTVQRKMVAVYTF